MTHTDGFLWKNNELPMLIFLLRTKVYHFSILNYLDTMLFFYTFAVESTAAANPFFDWSDKSLFFIVQYINNKQ
jgi:hypothetical protein